MDVLASLPALIAIQFYWLSVTLIGHVNLQWLQRKLKTSVLDDWQGLHFAVKVLLSAAVGFSIFGIVTIVGYVLRLPAWWLGVSYVMILVWTIYQWFLQGGVSWFKRKIVSLRILKAARVNYVMALLAVVLLLDYIGSLFIGGYLGGDGFIHISKIRYIAENGFSLTDAYYGTAPETRHHISVMHTLYAIPSWFGIDPLTSWFASLAWLRLLGWLSIFYLAWYVLRNAAKKGINRVAIAAGGTLVGVGLWGTYLMNYPGKFVSVWVVLFVIGMMEVFRKKSPLLLTMASLLVALSHSLVALGLFMLTVLVVVAMFVFDRKALSKAPRGVILASLALLMSTPVFSFFLPNQMTEAARNYGMQNYDYVTLGGLSSIAPNLQQYLGGISGAVITVLSVIGIGAIIYWQKSRQDKIIVSSLLLFVPLTVYNPVFATLAGEALPIWAQVRLLTVNVLTLVVTFSGLLALLMVVNKYVNYRRYPMIIQSALIIGSTAVLVFTYTLNRLPGADTTTSLSEYQQKTYSELRDLQQIVSVAEKGSVVMAERYYDNFMLPAMAPVHVIAISEGNSTPAADMKARTECYERLYEGLDYGLLKTANVRYVIAQKQTALHGLAQNKPYLELVSGNEDREIFRLSDDVAVQTSPPGVCKFKE